MPNSNDINDNRTRDLLACGAVPQSTAPPCCSPPPLYPQEITPVFLEQEVLWAPVQFWRFREAKNYLSLLGFEPWTVTERYGIHGTVTQQKYVVTQRHRSSNILFFPFFHFSTILHLLAPILQYFLHSSFLSRSLTQTATFFNPILCVCVCPVRLSVETQNILRLLEFSR